MHLGLRVLQLGPLYNNHLRRWSAHAVALGCTVYAGGHVSPGRRPVDLSGLAEAVEIVPEAMYGRGTAPHVAWLRSLIRRLQPDLVHAHWLPKWAYFAALAGPRALVVTAWGSDLYLAVGAQRRRADWALRTADGVLAYSCHMHDEMVARGVPVSRVHRAELGVDLERFRPAAAEEQTRLRRELGLPAGHVILSFRAGTELYNLDVLLEAFRLLRERLPDATLVLVHGDAPLSERARGLLDQLEGTGAVRAVGHIPHTEMPRYMRAATVGVSIPRSDGSPSSVWEALASGLPVVLSDLPQIEEKVGRSGAAALVEPRPEAVASALVGILAHPVRHRRMARAGRVWAVANVDQREQIARLGEVYAAIGGRPAPARATPLAAARVPPGGRDRATAVAPPPGPS